MQYTARSLHPPPKAQTATHHCTRHDTVHLPTLVCLPSRCTCEYFPSLTSFCLLRNQSGILYWRGFCKMVTIRSICMWEDNPVIRELYQATAQPKIHPASNLTLPSYLFFSTLSSPFVHVHVSLLAHDISITTSHALQITILS